MDKETLSNYGWIVILVLILAVMLALATPFGTFIAGAIKSTTAGLFSVNQAALGSAGIDVNDMVFENCDHLETEIRNATDIYTGDTFCKACGSFLQAGQTVRAKVPEGGKYTATDGTVYNPGDEMPETVTTGDLYEYGDYVYRYNQEFEGNSPTSFSTNESLNGWGVRWIGNKSIPTEILTSINGMPIASMQSTFSYSGITAIPEIPDTVVNLHWAFNNTHKLTADISNVKIPSSVVNMEQAFCTSAITKGPDMSEAVNVTNLKATFWMCKSLTEAPDLSNCTKLTSLQSTFADCISITDLSKFVFPENASYLYCTFSRCTNLVTAPVIPSTGSTMYSLFAGCTSLTGIVEINTEKDYYYTMCFQGVDFETQNLTLTGTATFLDKVGATGTNYCDVCNGRHKTSEEEHTCHGGTATCIEKAICMICNKSYGDLAICFAENISNGNCSLCGKTATAIESAHNPYPNSQNYIVIGTWDYHDAKSVNITLIYQFESIHYDWFSLAEGTDFISESSYNELRRYFTKYGSVSNNLTSSSSYTKFSSTTKTTQTFENVNMLTGSVVLKTNDTNNNYYGVTVIVTPNY